MKERKHWLGAIALLFISGGASANSLSLGPFDQGVYSGTQPFNVTGTCSAPGDDCNDTDNRVRTADLIQYSWSIAASGIPSGNPNFESVILEQTIVPGPSAVVGFDKIPTICLAPPTGPGGTDPLSSITDNADGSTTLLCNLGSMGNGEQKSFSVPVRPNAKSVNGSTFTSTQLVYALDAQGNKVVTDQVYVDNATYEISAAPAFDLIADRQNMYQSYTASYDLGEGAGLEPGYVSYFTAHIAADQDRAGKGIEALANNPTFRPVFTATGSDGVTPITDLPYRIVECVPNTSAWGQTVYGNESALPAETIEKKVVDSGTCSYAGDYQTGYTMTLNNLNTEGTRYPSETVNGTSLAAGPYFVGAYRLRVWVPFSALDAADGVPGNNTGSIKLTNCLSDFDPNSDTGISNYDAGFEPGYNGAAMPDGSASNNCTGPLTLQISASGGYSHRLVSTATDNGVFSHLPLASSYSSGDTVVEPTVPFAMFENVINRGSVSLNNAEACLMYDNTMMQLTDAGQIGATAGKYAYIANRTTGGFDHTLWKIEYGTTTYTGDDPLDGDADSVVDFNPVSGRYDGTWDAMRAMRCDNPGITNWNTDPNVIGIDNINIVRVTAIDPVNTALEAGQTIRLFVPLQMRDNFNGGPHAGTLIPPGAVGASMSTVRFDEFWPNWRNISYQPAPESTHGDGDRATFTRITIDVAKSTYQPLAGPGVTESVLAGNDVVWQLDPVVSSQLQGGGVAENLQVVDILSSDLTYDAQCTAALANATPPDLVETGFPAAGQTRLTWFLGDVLSTSVINPLIYCTGTDALSAAGSEAINTVFAKADNATLSEPNTQSVALGQAGSIQATVDVDSVLDSINDTQAFTLNWFNFSTTSSVSAPTIINVLPFNGDGAGASARAPQSDFTGGYELAGEPTVTFADSSVPGAAEPVIGQLLYSAEAASTINHDPNVNNSNWCEYDGTAFVNPSVAGGVCPASMADVTAIKHISNYELDTDGTPRQGLVMNYTMTATGNTPGDLYTNLFAVDSASLPTGQFIVSQRESVLISSFSIGDFVFVDINNNGVYDAATDVPALDGTPVELRLAADDSLVASTTTTDGNYLFDLIGEDDYYVQIPASAFAVNTPYGAWDAAINNQPANDDANQEVDHSGFVLANIATDGVRTDTVTTSAIAPPNPGAAPTGEEPVGDNTFFINDANTNDSFSNLTVDIGLLPGDADADGIPDILEFGSTDFNNLNDFDGDGTPDFLDTDSDNDGISDAFEAGANPSAPVDTDGDGFADYLDLDSDADGTPDSIEAGANPALPADTDADGIPDFLDRDSDNDGIADAAEAPNSGMDSDGDGIDDLYDVDSTGGVDANNDGVDDAVAALDSDGDGSPDYLDLDSDNDGINDIEEAGLIDNDGDGMVDGFVDADGDGLHDLLGANGVPDTRDTDGDGIIDRQDVDSDNDGIPDILEGTSDTDGDGVPDYLDIDSDNDGIPDGFEAGIAATDSDGDGINDSFDVDITGGADANNDGIDDAVVAAGLVDTDGDGLADVHDLDSDNDGLTDTFEAGGTDADGDGIVDGFTDTNNDGMDDATLLAPFPKADSDGDGVHDFRDIDSDNDGITDLVEAGGTDADNDGVVDAFADANNDGLDDAVALVPLSPPDTDADGTIDVLDFDSDGDGIPDALESETSNGALDTDGDGVPDHLDLDSDNDAISDAIEAPGTGVDTDGDGIDDAYDVDATAGLDANNDGIDDAIAAAGVLDSDTDGAADFRDRDSDADGIPDVFEGTGDTDADGTPDRLDTDTDGDGIPDGVEAQVTNVDTDGDGIDDLYDADITGGVDSNNDGVDDALAAAGTLDTDGNSAPDFRDLDSDSDGIPDAVEAGATPAMPVDTDANGVPDYLDLDSDSDGIPDAVEAGAAPATPVDTDANGVPDYLDLDSDSDGIPDAVEAGATPAVPADTDADGTPDYLELDSDNDSIPDAVEAGSTPAMPVDTDADGVADFLDSDSDADGVPDSIEITTDTDGDGIPDYMVMAYPITLTPTPITMVYPIPLK